MTLTSSTRRALLLSALIGLGVANPPEVSAAEGAGSFAVVSDIHLDPFTRPALAPALASSEPGDWHTVLGSIGAQAISRRGEDTNAALFDSAMTALSQTARDADFLLVPGDLLAHHFEDLAGKALGASPASPAVKDVTLKTVRYVARSLQAALPGRPIIVALGNNDSDCGDYKIEPQGAFLASTRDTILQLAGPDLVARDFDETYLRAGYFSMRHPTLPGTAIIVLNDVLWSVEYRNACGGNGIAAAEAMMTWLERRLVEQKTLGGRIWLVHHIPVGIDSYASLHDRRPSCPNRATPFLKEPFASRFSTLLRTFASTIQASFAGHTHRDSYRLITDGEKAVGIDKIAPAISPIFGNSPGYHLFEYNRQTGDPTDFSTWYLSNLDHLASGVAAEWRKEYTFTQAYGGSSYSAASVSQLTGSMATPDIASESRRNAFRFVSPGEPPEIGADALAADLCAILNLGASSFSTCFCRGGGASLEPGGG